MRVRRAMIIMASGTLVPAIARLVAADEDTGKRQSRPLCVTTSRAGPEQAPGII